MSKFCENCGAEMNEEDVVCKNCNTPVAGAKAEATQASNTTATESTGSANKPADTKKLAIIGGAIVAAVVILLSIIISIVSGMYKAPLKKYIKGTNKCDAETYLSAYPSFLKKSTKDSDLKKTHESYEKEYGDNVKLSAKVLKKTKISKDDLKDVKEYIKKKYNEDVKVSKGFKLKVKTTIKGRKDYDYATTDHYVYKIDGKWYLLEVSPDDAASYIK